jgi:DNA polymerase-4
LRLVTRADQLRPFFAFTRLHKGLPMATLLTLLLPDFVVDVERRWEGLSADVPLIVGGSAEGPGQVVAACRVARAAGVRPGQPLREAARLAPGARFVPGILDRYAETASMLDELVRRWCAEVDWVSIDRAVIPASAIKAGALAAAADAMQRAIRDDLGLSTAAGLADTEVAAAVAASLVAPSGLLQVLPGYDQRFLAPLDMRWLPGLSGAARERLAEQGVDTIGALAALAPPEAEAAIGSGWAAAWRMARAEEPRALASTALPRSLTRAIALGSPVGSEDVQLAAEHLADQMAQRLIQIGAFAHALTVRVMGADQRFRGRTLTLREAARQRTDLAPAARALAARLWKYGDPPVRVSLVATGLSADGPQLSLFDLASEPAAALRRHDGLRTTRSFRALAKGSLARRTRAS